jgi:D-tyrosyl-tRNA(Tyr) deacylase
MVGEIGAGLAVLLGITHSDTVDLVGKMAAKVANLRVMDDAAGVMNRSVLDVGGQVLVVSQFTLYGDTSGGRRPSWIAAARPEVAEPLVAAVVEDLRRLGLDVATGRFRTTMAVEIVNDGPTTVIIDL